MSTARRNRETWSGASRHVDRDVDRTHAWEFEFVVNADRTGTLPRNPSRVGVEIVGGGIATEAVLAADATLVELSDRTNDASWSP